MGELTIARVRGAAVLPYLEGVAELRIAVFREFPYLYDGDPAYEREYLRVYAASEKSVIVLALDDGRIVGASTGLPLAESDADFRRPFERAGYPVEEVFYFV